MQQMTLSNYAVPQQGRHPFLMAASSGPENTKVQSRYEAAKSLNIVRLNIQRLINKDIDNLLKKYIDKFFQPAIANIKNNLGEECVTDNNIRMVCIQMLDDAKSQYFLSHNMVPKPAPVPFAMNKVDKLSPAPVTMLQTHAQTFTKANQTEMIYNDDINMNDFLKMHYLPSQGSTSGKHREEADNEKGKKKIMRTVTSILPGTPTPIKLVKLEGIRREGPKWDPNRITSSTLFIMGARANKVLGFGQTRGRLYTKHPELLKYSGDTEDKEWLSRNNLMPPTGGIAYLLLLEDIRELAESEDYRRNPNVLLHELKGFLAPDFMLVKIRTFLAHARTEGQEDLMYQYYDPNTFIQGIHKYNREGEVSFQQNLSLPNSVSPNFYNVADVSGNLIKIEHQNYVQQFDVNGAITCE